MDEQLNSAVLNNTIHELTISDLAIADLAILDLAICRIPGLKSEERIKLQEKFDKEDDFSVLSMKDVEKILGRNLKVPAWKMHDILSMANKDAEISRKLGIRLVSRRDKAYPPLLREIFDPPALLFYRGALPDPEKPMAAVVGTRKPTPQAAKQAFALGRDLGLAGIAVVSGLALGIDSMAHRGNIEGGAPTVAVLGSGPDMIYPVTNRFLARRILETGGLILSEYPPGTVPYKSNFPARNRIISALARGVVIVEAPEKSGSLITASFALDQNRDLWVDKIGLSSGRGLGGARLVEDGAVQISSAADIVAEWGLDASLNVRPLWAEEKSAGGLASSMAEYLNIKL
jgi:DNA processing protein